jgi:hypothetical protein
MYIYIWVDGKTDGRMHEEITDGSFSNCGSRPTLILVFDFSNII